MKAQAASTLSESPLLIGGLTEHRTASKLQAVPKGLTVLAFLNREEFEAVAWGVHFDLVSIGNHPRLAALRTPSNRLQDSAQFSDVFLAGVPVMHLTCGHAKSVVKCQHLIKAVFIALELKRPA